MQVPVDQKGPYVQVITQDKIVPFLVDTGATKSSIVHQSVPGAPLSGTYNTSIGFSGTPVSSPVSKPMDLIVGPYALSSSLILTRHCKENLLGLDLLKRLYATIYCSPDGVYVTMGPCTTGASYFSRPAELPPELAAIPITLWAQSDTDVGHLRIMPFVVKLRENTAMPRVPQYKIPHAGEEALLRIVADLILKGVVEETRGNMCNSPILPILKKSAPNEPPVYRFVVDLREVNKVVVPQFPVVPDITTLLTMIPPTAAYFTVVDLKNAFFSIPIAVESRDLFGFTIRGRSFRFCRAPQGYTESQHLQSSSERTIRHSSVTNGHNSGSVC